MALRLSSFSARAGLFAQPSGAVDGIALRAEMATDDDDDMSDEMWLELSQPSGLQL